MASRESAVRAIKGSLVWLLLLQAACARQIVSVRELGGFALRPTPRELSASEQLALARFLSEIAALLPARVKGALAQTIAVSFFDVEAPLRPPACESDAPPPELDLSQLERTDESQLRIALHAGFREVIAAGAERAAHYPCGHRTMYRLAQAAIIRQVLRAFDDKLRLSTDKQYANLHRFAPQGIFRRVRSRNVLTERSPDPYEFRSLGESFAVHGEYFLLDPEYRCRLPASYEFFVRAFGGAPAAPLACRMRTVVYDGVEPIDIDPARVYAVHYLWASEGRGAQSRFGHAMLRLVVCGRDRERVDAACELDVQDHVVLSFAANLHGELRISAVKGLLGKYSSQLFVRPLPQVIIEYTERELRDLYSFPLRLERREIDALVLRVLEIFWGYEGRYFFLSNNCGTETLSLLRAVLPAARTAELSALTPRGIRDVLLRSGLASPLDLGALTAFEQRGLFFPSAREAYESSYRRLRGALSERLPRSMMRYLEKTSAQNRRALFVRHGDPQALSDLYALEGVAYRRREQLVMMKLLKLYLRGERHGLHVELRKKVAQLIARGELHQPWRWPGGGYGVPLAEERIDVPASVSAQFLTSLRAEVTRLLAAELAADHAELLATEENQRWLAAQILLRAEVKLRTRPRDAAIPVHAQSQVTERRRL